MLGHKRGALSFQIIYIFEFEKKSRFHRHNLYVSFLGIYILKIIGLFENLKTLSHFMHERDVKPAFLSVNYNLFQRKISL